MHLFHVNVLAVLISTIACMFIGGLWYSPILFANAWTKEIGRTMGQLKMSPVYYLYCALFFFVMSFAFAKILSYTSVTDVLGSVEIAAIIWLGLLATTMGVNYLFEGKSKKLYFINIGNHLVSLLAISIIIGLWR